MMKNDIKLFERFQKDFNPEWMKQHVKINSDFMTMWSVASSIQLACRHPQFTGPTAHEAQLFAEMIFDKIATTETLKEVAEKGWDQNFDEDWE